MAKKHTHLRTCICYNLMEAKELEFGLDLECFQFARFGRSLFILISHKFQKCGPYFGKILIGIG